MFRKLPYKSKIEVCKFYYSDRFGSRFDLPTVYFSWNYVEFETVFGDTRVKRSVIEMWYEKNIKLIRKQKLLSITKRETVI